MAATLTLKTTATYCDGPHYFTVGVPTPHGVAVLVDHTTHGAPAGAVLVVYDGGDPQRLRAGQPPVFYGPDGEVLSDYVRSRIVWAVTVEDACGRRRKVGVRATTRRIAWETAALMCGDEQPIACKEEDRSVDFDAGR